jgi:hypothetical protein
MFELTLVMVVLTVAMGMFTSTVNSTARQRSAKREAVIAAEGARRILEVMRAQEFQDLFALYNAYPGDDPEGPGSGPGADFVVPGLTPRAADADGLVGKILFGSPGPALSEQADYPELGYPRDISGNGDEDNDDHSGDYVLLPVQIRVEWVGAGGERALNVFTSFTNL